MTDPSRQFFFQIEHHCLQTLKQSLSNVHKLHQHHTLNASQVLSIIRLTPLSAQTSASKFQKLSRIPLKKLIKNFKTHSKFESSLKF